MMYRCKFVAYKDLESPVYIQSVAGYVYLAFILVIYFVICIWPLNPRQCLIWWLGWVVGWPGSMERPEQLLLYPSREVSLVRTD